MSTSKYSILGVMIDAIDYDTATSQIIDAAFNKQPFGVSALAVHGVMTGVLDQEHRYRLNHLDLVVPDGMPVKWALNKIHKTHLANRIYGPKLMLAVCEKAAQYQLPIYLFGSSSFVLDKLVQNLKELYPALIIAGQHPSLFRKITIIEKLVIVHQIKASGAKIVFVGLGCPRQEVWVFEHLQYLPMPMLAVGAAFDFHAGVLKQAPVWLQERGLEWLFRLLHEPRRLWKRYLLLNPIYSILTILQWLRIYHFEMHKVNKPYKEIRFG